MLWAITTPTDNFWIYTSIYHCSIYQPNMRSRNKRWLLQFAILLISCNFYRCNLEETNTTLKETLNNGNSSRTDRKQSNSFSPRMDYEHWTPLGHGDPLKNDPTYDYVPPMLDRVHYWIDPTPRKAEPQFYEDSKKTEILLLGVTSKNPSIRKAESRVDNYDTLVKFKGDSYKASRPQYQSPQNYYQNNKLNFQLNNNNHVPYTILMPPPLPAYHQIKKNNVGKLKTTPSPVTIQHANLVYHSSTLGGLDSWDRNNQTIADSSNQVTWRTPLIFPNIQNNSDNLSTNFVMVSSHDKNVNIMHKGHVSDDNLDEGNTYVNIGKPEASVQNEPLIYMNSNPYNVYETATESPKANYLSALLTKEATPFTFSTMQTFLENIPRATTKIYTTTTTPASTTKGYRLNEPRPKNRMYLIIQGHSKVKTYGPAKTIHGIRINEFNEIPQAEYKDLYQVKHLHTPKKKSEFSSRIGRSKNLSTLSDVVQTGYGAINYDEKGDLKETELISGYSISEDETESTSELYHKGIVENDLMFKT